MDNQTPALEMLMACQIACAWSARMLGGSLERSEIDEFIAHRDLFDEEPFRSADAAAAKRLREICAEAACAEDGAAALWHQTRQDYAYLFYMASASKVFAYESVYRTDDATLCGPTMFEVREAYRRFGFDPDLSGGVPADHVAVELAFLAALFSRAMNVPDEAQAALCAAKTFMGDHVATFVFAMLDSMRAHARSDWYRATACLIAALAAQVSESLDAWCGDRRERA